jgi:hypothetical protein
MNLIRPDRFYFTILFFHKKVAKNIIFLATFLSNGLKSFFTKYAIPTGLTGDLQEP